MFRLVHGATALSAAALVAVSSAPAAHADNSRLNNGVVANVYTVQHQAGCTTDIKKNPALTLAAQWHAQDVLNNRALDGDIGSDGSTPQQRAAAAGFNGKVAQTVAITGGKVVIGDGSDPIEGGTVLVQNGKVTAAGRDVVVPAGIPTVDAKGKWVTPGLVVAITDIGLYDVEAVDDSNDTDADKNPFSASLDISQAINPDAQHVKVSRAGGVTRAAIAPIGTKEIFGEEKALRKKVMGIKTLTAQCHKQIARLQAARVGVNALDRIARANLALFDDRAQKEVWGANPDTLVSSSYQPVGKVEPTEGGFYLSGRWGFSTGSLHCGWVLLGALVSPQEEGGAPDMRTFLLPRSDYQIIEGTWDTFGLQGTGSFDIVVDRAFVPDYRTHRAVDGFMCNNPGQAANDGPLYSLPWAQVFVRSVSTAAFGGARAAVNAAMKIMQDRVSTNTGKASKADPMLHAAIAKAHAPFAVASIGTLEVKPSSRVSPYIRFEQYRDRKSVV